MHHFEVMAEPIRRRIIEILAVGEHRAGNISEVIRHEFTVTPAAVSHHLRVLRETGFVTMRREENLRIYALDSYGIEGLERDVRELKALWENRLGWLAPGDPMVAGVHRYTWSKPTLPMTNRGFRGKAPDGFTVATRARRGYFEAERRKRDGPDM